MKWLVLLFALLAAPLSHADEVTVTAPESIEAGINDLPNGGTLYLSGNFDDYKNRLRITNRYYSEKSPLIVDGQGKTVFGYDAPLNLQDCQWVIVRNCEFHGGAGFNNSLKDYSKCLAYIRIEGCVFKYGQIFAGGYTYHDIEMFRCLVDQVIYNGNVTHAIYFSGGHWEGSIGMPHPNNLFIVGCKIRWAGGRHGIQVNGCYDRVRIQNNVIYGCALAGFQGIGIDDFIVSGNLFFAENRRSGVIVYDYWDQAYWSMENLEEWKQCHHPNANWTICYNTFAVGPHSWGNWWEGSKPDKRPAIHINNEVNGQIDYPPGKIWIFNNILASPWAPMIQFDDLASACQTTIARNLMWTYDATQVPMITANSDVPVEPHWLDIPSLEKYFPQLYWGNVVADPKFKIWPPEYPDASQIPPPPNYDWGQNPMKFNFYSPIGARRGFGRPASWYWNE